MSKLPELSGKELAGTVKKLGLVYSHTTGSHMVFRHLDGRRTVILHHAGEKIGPRLLNKIIKQDLQVSREEFIKHM